MHESAQALVTQAGRTKPATLPTRQPILGHPLAQGLARHLKPVVLCGLLGRQRRPEVGVAPADKDERKVTLPARMRLFDG